MSRSGAVLLGVNVNAFLDMLAWSEGTAGKGDDGYNVIVQGVGDVTIPELFWDYSSHPFANGRPPKMINRAGLMSSASGRYQHMRADWAYYRRALALPDFGPLSQDKWAVQLIRERKALKDVSYGRVEDAIYKCRTIWASLPGSPYGQPTHALGKAIAAYTAHGGVISQ